MPSAAIHNNMRPIYNGIDTEIQSGPNDQFSQGSSAVSSIPEPKFNWVVFFEVGGLGVSIDTNMP